MPELPEVETVRRSLEPLLVGRIVTRVRLARGRRDIVCGPATPAALLSGCRIIELRRKGKQLAIVARAEVAGGDAPTPRPRPGDGDIRALVVHLGMTGQLLALQPGQRPEKPEHIHARWTLSSDAGPGVLIFRDPRRFGGLFPYRSLADLDAQWTTLGPDGLSLDSVDDAMASLARLWAGARSIKAALLDQRCIAGVGNIYADESLFEAGVNPALHAARLTDEQRRRLVEALSRTLARAVAARGSTLRDYTDGHGQPGAAQLEHRVYGRSGERCTTCRTPLRSSQLAQRTTVWCPTCQP